MIRRTLFWIHLIAGVISGMSIGIMSFTGAVLAFEKEIVAWAERDARMIAPPPPGTPRLSLDRLKANLHADHPDAQPTSIVLQNDPLAAVAFPVDRTVSFYANPHTGEVRQPQSLAMSRFMRRMVEWHRYLGLGGAESRPRGKLINGICNVAFCLLAVTGVYLWMPRQWSWRAVRPVIWFRQNSTSKARDFNWHNSIGFWSAPVLIVLTLTAMPISFRWAGSLIYTLTGTPLSAGGSTGRASLSATPVAVGPSSPGARPMTFDALFTAAQQHVPEWKSITLRLPNSGNMTLRSSSGGAGRGAMSPSRVDGVFASRAEVDVAETRATVPAVTVSIREKGSWPRTATTTLALNPYSGDVLSRSGYGELNAAQKVRSWTRFLHTGEAVGWAGQLAAGLASLGGVFLVYTGFALSWRRFFRKSGAPESGRDVSASV